MMLDALRAAHPAPGRITSGPVKWYGGKGASGTQIVPFLDIGLPRYVEPFCGGASLFFRKEPAPYEVLNDVHGEIVNLFRVLQSPTDAAALQERLAATPVARAEFARALAVGADASPVERAWAFFTRQNQGYAGQAKTIGDWGTTNFSYNGVNQNVSTWRSRVLRLSAQAERLARAVIDERDGVACIEKWDTPETLHYVDPPYPRGTRKSGNDYTHEMTDADHARILAALVQIKGVAVVSSYENAAYDEALVGWRKVTFPYKCRAITRYAAVDRNRTEVVWLSPNHPKAVS